MKAINENVKNDKPTYQELENQIDELKKQNEILKSSKDSDKITKRKQAEAVAKSNDLLTSVIKQAPFAIHILEGDFHNIKVVIANQESARIMGEVVQGRSEIDADIPEALSTRFFTIDGKQEIPLSRMPSPRAFNGEVVAKEEFLFRHPDGTEIMVEVSASPVYDASGQIRAVTVTFHDITERKQVEKIQAESELQFRSLSDASMEGIGIVQYDQILIVNKKVCELFGYDQNEIVGKTFLKFVAIESRELALKNFRDRFKEPFEIVAIRKNGSKFLAEVCGKTMEFKGCPGRVVAIRDITERKQAEEEINRMAKILNIAPNSITIHDFNGNFIYANQKTFDIHGYTRDEFFALPLGKLDTPETTKLIPARMKEISERGEANFQVEHIRKDGSIFPMEVFAQLTKWGDTNSILSIATDITERKQAEAIKSIQYEIIRNVFSTKNLSEFYETVRGALGRIMNVENFYVAFYDEKTDQLSAVFEKDKKDQIPKWPSGKSLTGRVIKEQKPLILKKAEILNLANTGEIELIGTTAEAWLGVPLIIGGKVSGVLVVQDYDNPQAYNQTHLELLEMVSTEMSICIERKQAVEALKESEEHARHNNELLRSIMESPKGMIIFSLDPQYRYTAFTVSHKETMKYIWGVDIKVGMNMLDVIHKDGDREKAKHNFDLALRGEPFILIEEYGADDLYRTWWENRYSPIYSDTNTIVGLTVFVTDITERKQAEEALKESEEKYRTLTFSIPGMTYRGGIDWSTEIVTNLEEVSGYSIDEWDIQEMNWLNLIHPDDKQAVIKDGIKLSKNPMSMIQEYRIIHKDEKIRWVRDYKTSVFKDDGTFIGIDGIVFDITERKQHEKELKIAKEKIEESEEKHRTVADYANDWEYWIDTNGNFVYISPSCKRITGYKPDDFLNNKELMQEIIYPDDVNIFQNHKHDIDENIERSQTEFRIITKQKKIRWIGHVCQNVIATNGKLLGVRGSNRDITDRKKAEQALMKSEAELKELNATKDKLYSIIAHDLRSPFNSILGFSELLIENVNDFGVAESEEYLGIINSTAKNTLILLDNLLNWAKAQTGNIIVKPENFILSELIQEIIETSKSTAKSKNISLNYSSLDEIEVYADENMLMVVLRNLISNAIKYTETGGNVNIFVISVENQVEISISDDGVGMKDETRKKLFNISTNITTKGTANEKGSGLGLVLCKEFVEKLGGNIWVESEEGKGSTFHFTLPYESETIKESSSKNEILPPVEVSPTKKFKILIVEDDETSIELLSITVRKLGNEIINVKNGKEAVEACLDNPDIDLVLMDILMPEMDGHEATRQIRKFNKDVIIIAQTAYALEGDKEKAIAAGCNDYMSKPINANELKHMIIKHM